MYGMVMIKADWVGAQQQAFTNAAPVVFVINLCVRMCSDKLTLFFLIIYWI